MPFFWKKFFFDFMFFGMIYHTSATHLCKFLWLSLCKFFKFLDFFTIYYKNCYKKWAKWHHLYPFPENSCGFSVCIYLSTCKYKFVALRIPRNQWKGYTLKEHFRFKKRRKHLTSIKNGYSDEEKEKKRLILFLTGAYWEVYIIN